MSVNNFEEQRLQLPFDLYQRYKIIADLIEAVRDRGRIFSILEVGSGGHKTLGLFLPGDRIYYLDKSFPPELAGKSEFVTGDATNLPFNNGTFDLVISTDVYEHIVPGQRHRCLIELIRISKEMTVLAAPFNTGKVASYERRCNEHYRAIFSTDHPWLKEHIANGLPDLETTFNFIKGQGYHVEIIPNGYLTRWLTMQVNSFITTNKPALLELVTQLNSFYNLHFYEADNREPSYRKVLAIPKTLQNKAEISFFKEQVQRKSLHRRSIGSFEYTLQQMLNNIRHQAQI